MEIKSTLINIISNTTQGDDSNENKNSYVEPITWYFIKPESLIKFRKNGGLKNLVYHSLC